MRCAKGTGSDERAMSAEPRLHVEVEGSGPVVVLAHGFGGSARNFLSQARALRDRYRIVRFDARGHARSEAPAEASAYTPDVFVADLGPGRGAPVRRGAPAPPPPGLAHPPRGVLAGEPSLDELARLAELARPALVIVGARDRMSLPTSRALAEALPRAKLVVVEGAGHVVNLAQPAAFNRALEEFLAAAVGGA